LNPGYCVIGNVCYMDGTPSPTDPCQACTITSSTSLWTPEPEGAPCGTGKSCQSHVCTACGALGQACCGTATPGTCVVGAACNASTNQCQADKAIDISGGAWVDLLSARSFSRAECAAGAALDRTRHRH